MRQPLGQTALEALVGIILGSIATGLVITLKQDINQYGEELNGLVTFGSFMFLLSAAATGFLFAGYKLSQLVQNYRQKRS